MNEKVKNEGKTYILDKPRQYGVCGGCIAVCNDALCDILKFDCCIDKNRDVVWREEE